jgi:prepilin-type N-terminal cleavage/methylation domain-containing protein/prepilin-type processing-associated H-X9-DG protein
MNSKPACSRRAFSLVELLVVIGIIGVLLSLLLPAVQQVREAANRVSCSNNLHQLGLAFHHYHDVQGAFPPAYAFTSFALPHRDVQWPVLILPYIEQAALWQKTLDAYQTDKDSWHNPPHVGLATVIRTYVCPSDGRLLSPITDDAGLTAAYGSYLGVTGGMGVEGRNTDDGVMRLVQGVRISEITDGTTTTLMVGERPAPGFHLNGCWYTQDDVNPAWASDDDARGRIGALVVYNTAQWQRCEPPFQFGPGRLENPCDADHFWSFHPGGANFLFADGAVHFLAYSAAPIMVPLATRAGGEVVSLPD